MSIQDLLSWIDRSSQVGELTARKGDLTRIFQVDRGIVTSSSSSLPGERLSQVLLSRELVSEAQLREAFVAQQDTGVRIGKVLLMTGAVDEQALRGILELKVREALCDLLSWQRGIFHFEPGTATAPEVAVAIPLGTTIDLGVHQAARWRSVQALVGDDDAKYWVLDHMAVIKPGTSEQIQRQVSRLVDCIERGLTVRQMVLEHHGRRFQVLHHLADLVQRSAIALERRAAPREPTEDSTDGASKTVLARIDAGDLEGAFELSSRLIETAPDDADLVHAHERAERALFAELSRELLVDFRVPVLRKSSDELAGLELSDTERYMVGRVDGRWDLLSLMRISPVRELEALLTFKRLAARGIIGF